MEAGPSKQPVKPARSGGGRIRRGQACASCRQLKIKCDGAKPKCGPCTRIRRMHPCEYGDEQANARMRSLEHEIEALRQKIRELENTERPLASASIPSVGAPLPLQDPYPTPVSLSNHNTPGGSMAHARTLSPVGLSPADETDVSSIASHLSPQDIRPRQESRLPTPDRGPSTFGLSPERRAVLIRTFIAYADRLGFFLGTERLLNTLIVHAHPGSSLLEPPSPSVMCCVFLWGLHLLDIRSTRPAEPTFLEEAIKLTATSLLSATWHTLILDTIQAHLLLALYLLCSGKFDLARIHSTAAVSLIVAHDLHRFSVTNDGAAVWQVVIFEKTMAAALNSVSSPVTHAGGIEASGVVIDVPWPGDSPVQGGINRVATFLEGLPDDTGLSLNALYLKSVILFHQAFYMADQWVLDLHHMRIEMYTSLDNLITSFKALVLALPDDGSNRARLLQIHSLLNGATIRLHLPFAAGAESSSAKCISAAREVVDFASELMGYDQGGGWCHPTFGAVWMDVCIVFGGEIKRTRTVIGQPFQSQAEQEYMELLRRMTGIMVVYSQASVLMGLQRRKVDDMLKSLGL